MTSSLNFRRKFLGGLAGLWAARYASGGQEGPAPAGGERSSCPSTRLLRITGRSNNRATIEPVAMPIGGLSPPGETKEVFNANGPGVISHIWFTIAAPSTYHLKEIVLRIYWDGNAKPSVEVPVGDFFGLNLGMYNVYQSAFLNCSSVKALNCYFAMPFRKSARITATNEGSKGSQCILLEYRLSACSFSTCTVPLLPRTIPSSDSESGYSVSVGR